MTAILATCMATLFAWWIWSLKHELAQQHGQEMAQAGIPLDLPPEPHAVEQKSHAFQRPIYPDSPKRRNAGGVAVWTIS